MSSDDPDPDGDDVPESDDIVSPSDVDELTELVNAWREGHAESLEKLFPLIYDELRRLAHGYLKSERREHTLSPTALVNEAYLKLAQQRNVQFNNRGHFFAVAARSMRRILVDHARRRSSEKRGGGEVLIEFEEGKGSPIKPSELVALDDALKAYAEQDRRGAHIVELRHFGGLSIDETADALGISPATVKREWVVAKAWLKREATRGRASP